MGIRTILACAGILAALPASLSAQTDKAAELRASLLVGEQADGYLGLVGTASPAIRAQVDSINILRRAYYKDLAAKRGAKTEEVAATTACELFRAKVASGQYYRLPDGLWRQRDSEPVPLPAYCGNVPPASQQDDRVDPAWNREGPSRQAINEILRDLNRAESKIERAVQRRVISPREAVSLRRQGNSIRRRLQHASRDGIAGPEFASLRLQVNRLEQRLRSERNGRGN